MITLHRLGHQVEAFHLNPEHIVTVEANPDTVITLTNGCKIVVAEPPDRVVADARDHRIDILAGAMQRRHELRANGQRPYKGTPVRVPSASAAPLRAVAPDAS